MSSFSQSMLTLQQRRAKAIALVVIMVALFSQFALPGSASAQNGSYVRLLRWLDRDQLTLANPTGLLYVDNAAQFLVTTTATGVTQSQTIAAISPYGDLLATATIPADLADPVIAYDPSTRRLLLRSAAKGEPNRGELVAAPLLGNGLPNWEERTTVAQAVHIAANRAIAVASNGAIYQLNTDRVTGINALQIFALSAADTSKDADPDRSAVAAAGESTNLAFATQPLQGLAIHPQTGHLFAVESATQRLLEFTAEGQYITFYDLAPFGLQAVQGLTFAPSGDQTDDPNVYSLYLLATTKEATATTGSIAEVTFAPPLPSAAQTIVTDMGTLIKTTKTFEYAPPSPDPAGIAYIPQSACIQTSNRLLISDSEVNEMALYDGANVFETTYDGLLQTTYTTYPTITGEPAGLTFNPNNCHLFFTDDDNIRPLIEVDPGPDKIFLSGDDTFTKFSLSSSSLYGNQDPEGVDYARINGVDHLFIVDGLNSELYIAKAGPGGLFNGVVETVQHFDTKSPSTLTNETIVGVEDPEGIAYDTRTGTLYIVGEPPTRVAEFDLNGNLLRFVDIAAAKADKPAGLAFAPGSNNPNESHLYIVDRAVDNDSKSSENDGMLYELAIPVGSNQPPVVTLAPTLTVNWPAAILLAGEVTDDGQPDPPALTVEWSKLSGPGTVTFADASAPQTTATVSEPGIYELQLAADDGEFTGTATIVVTVEATNMTPTVDAGPDQALELSETITVTAQVADDGLPIHPGAVSIEWSKVSGPGEVTFGTGDAATTTVRFDKVGNYVLRATVSDGELSSSDDLSVVVAPDNAPPVVNAGVDQHIGLGDSAALNGSATDDGLPALPGQLTVRWRKVSGAGSVTFGDANEAETTVSFSARDTYELELSAGDGKLTVSDSVIVVVDVPNTPPTVDAGPDLRTTLTETVALQGQVSDDGIPSPPGTLTVAWSQVSGPGTVTFADQTSPTTTVQADVIGVYVLQLHASDGKLDAVDTMSLNIGRPNQPPVILAPVLGAEPLVVGASTTLSVTAEDDFIPAPAGKLTYSWEAISGPDNPLFATPTSAETVVTFSALGSYTVRVTISDGELSSALDFVLLVEAPNFAPQVAVEANLTLDAPGTIQITAEVTDDGKPEPANLHYSWTQLSGPAAVIFGNSAALSTSVQFFEPGSYQLRFTADDSELQGIGTVTVTVGTGDTFTIYLPVIR